jgi:Barstar (barnase inhibitor)
MGAFDAADQTKEALDWVILRHGGIALYWRREYLDEDLKWFRQQNYQLYSFNCEKWTSDGMHADLERTLSFPSYYGRNLDALWDCLQNLSVPEQGGTVIVLNRFDAFQKGRGAALLPSGRAEGEIVLDILVRTSRYFLLTGKRFLTLVQSDDPRIHFERLGGVGAICWREWQDKNRGL